MKTMIVFLVALISLPCSAAPAFCANNIKWLAGNLPPFIWEQKDGAHGYGYELIAAMSEQIGCKPDISFVPWARAVKTTVDGTNYGVLPLARTPDREKSFRWLIRLENVKYTFFALSSPLPGTDAIDVDNPERLRTKKIGVLRGSPIAQNLTDKKFTNIIYETSYQDLLRMLDRGAIAAVYAGYPMLTAAIDTSGFDSKKFRSGASIGSADLYLGTSLNTDAKESARWLQAYDALQKDGTVARLQNKYFKRTP